MCYNAGTGGVHSIALATVEAKVAERKVHIVDRNGRVRFNRLLDSGGEAIPFGTSGWVDRHDSRMRGERIVDGWLTLAEMDAVRATR